MTLTGSTMRWSMTSIQAAAVCFALVGMTTLGCQHTAQVAEGNTLSLSVGGRVPRSFERLLILYAPTDDPLLRAAYSRLEAEAFGLKNQRPALRILDRIDGQMILREQQFQSHGMVSDETAVHLGHLLGADSLLFYRIEAPTLRDQIRAQFSGTLPSITVMSKIVAVETGEIVFQSLIATPIQDFSPDDSPGRMDSRIQTALEHSLKRTTEALRAAFE